MILETTDPTLVKIQNGKRYYFAADGGDVTLERQAEDGTWVEITGSPITDGEEVIVLTSSVDEYIRATADTVDTVLTKTPVVE